MLHKVKWWIVGFCALILVFNFMPTGHSAYDLVTGFENTNQEQGGRQASKLVSMYSKAAARTIAPEIDTVLSNTTTPNGVREALCTFAVKVAGSYGCGWYISGSNYEHAQQVFQYSSNVGGEQYGSTSGTTRNGKVYAGYNYSKLYSGVSGMVDGTFFSTYDYQNISCAAYATFCWATILANPSVYTAGGGRIGRNNQNVLSIATNSSDRGYSQVIANAKPGDLIEYYGDPVSLSPGYHTALYLGSYTFKDASGNDVTFEHAIAQSSDNEPGCHVHIRNFGGAGSGRYVGYVSLDAYMSSVLGMSEDECIDYLSNDTFIQAVLALPYEVGTFNDLESGGI